MPINGNYFDWEDLVVLLPTGPAYDLTEINDNVERDVEHIYGQGSAPRGTGTGNLKLDGSIKMKREEYNKFVAYCAAAGKTIFTIAPFTITANYANEDQGMSTDQYMRVKVKGRSKSMKQGDKSAEVDVPIIFEDIKENSISLAAGLNLE